MKYTAKGLETEPYKAYSRDAFNDEEKGVLGYGESQKNRANQTVKTIAEILQEVQIPALKVNREINRRRNE